jgi:hypothetical protein
MDKSSPGRRDKRWVMDWPMDTKGLKLNKNVLSSYLSPTNRIAMCYESVKKGKGKMMAEWELKIGCGI